MSKEEQLKYLHSFQVFGRTAHFGFPRPVPIFKFLIDKAKCWKLCLAVPRTFIIYDRKFVSGMTQPQH